MPSTARPTAVPTVTPLTWKAAPRSCRSTRIGSTWDTLSTGNATTADIPAPWPRPGWLNWAVPLVMLDWAQPSWLPAGPLKQPTRVTDAGPRTVALAARIGTFHSVPTTFQ